MEDSPSPTEARPSRPGHLSVNPGRLRGGSGVCVPPSRQGPPDCGLRRDPAVAKATSLLEMLSWTTVPARGFCGC